MHLCEFHATYRSRRRKRRLARRARRAAAQIDAEGKLLAGWGNREAGVARAQARLEAHRDFLQASEAMIVLEGTAEQVMRLSRDLGGRFKAVWMDKELKKQLIAFWLWTWVREGKDTEAFPKVCKRLQAEIKPFVEKCYALDAVTAKYKGRVDEAYEMPDWRSPPELLGGTELEKSLIEVFELQEEWVKRISHFGEYFDREADYVAKWRETSKEYRRQARRDRRRVRPRSRLGVESDVT